jgi:hypothetical protein
LLIGWLPGKGVHAEETNTQVTLKNPTMSDGVSTWDCIYFGNYYQSDATGKKKEPIKWRVLSSDGNESLLISDCVLDVQQYNVCEYTAPYTTWETSHVREWLNDEFVKTAFSDEEKSAILQTHVVTPSHNNSSGGNPTDDLIYVPSYEDMKNTKYGFSDKWTEQSKTRLAPNTEYVVKKDKYITENLPNEANMPYEEGKFYPSVLGASDYVLRTNGYNGETMNSVSCINNGKTQGRGRLGGCFTNHYYGIRPMLRIDLTKTIVWKYAGTVNSEGAVLEYQYNQKTGEVKVVKETVSDIGENSKKETIKKAKIKKIISAGNYKVRLSVAKVSGATGYQYRYATNKKLKKAVKKATKKTTVTISKLKKNKKYYFSVRAYKIVNGKKQYGAWSIVKSFKTTKKKTRNYTKA